jgi:uncharacterized protein YyaL (SSP411 family)
MAYDRAMTPRTPARQPLKVAILGLGTVGGTYILRDMTSPEGGFYSAEDADSEGVEGKFYLWSLDEVKEILGEEEGRSFASYYDITGKGNFEGRSIPNLINNNLPYENISSVKSSRDKLFDYREDRIHPYKDDKILTSWNGLMIAAMAICGRIAKDERFTEAAKKAVAFIYSKLVRNDGRLLARYRDGESNFPAYANDYAFLTLGLIELYETTYEADYLKKALELTGSLLSLFWDEENGGLYVYGKDSEMLITRPKELYDGAEPSGNSVSALNFYRLSRLTGRADLEEKAEQIFKAFSADIRSNPVSYSYALAALMFGRSKGQEIVIAAESAEAARAFTDNIHDIFRPTTVSLVYKPGDQVLKELAPFVEPYSVIDGRAAAYVCEGFSCRPPVTDSNEFADMLQ